MGAISELISKKQERLALYEAAEVAILGGAQSYSIGNRTLTRADLQFIADMIKRLEKDLIKLDRGKKITAHRVVPRDGV